MPIMEPDTSEVKTMLPLDAGVYKAKVVAVDFKTSKAGNPMIVPEFEIADPEGVLRKRSSYLVIKGEAAFGFDSFLRAVGMQDTADQIKSGEKIPIDTDIFIGLELNVQIENDTYNGRITDQVKGFLPA